MEAKLQKHFLKFWEASALQCRAAFKLWIELPLKDDAWSVCGGWHWSWPLLRISLFLPIFLMCCRGFMIFSCKRQRSGFTEVSQSGALLVLSFLTVITWLEQLRKCCVWHFKPLLKSPWHHDHRQHPYLQPLSGESLQDCHHWLQPWLFSAFQALKSTPSGYVFIYYIWLIFHSPMPPEAS